MIPFGTIARRAVLFLIASVITHTVLVWMGLETAYNAVMGCIYMAVTLLVFVIVVLRVGIK